MGRMEAFYHICFCRVKAWCCLYKYKIIYIWLANLKSTCVKDHSSKLRWLKPANFSLLLGTLRLEKPSWLFAVVGCCFVWRRKRGWEAAGCWAPSCHWATHFSPSRARESISQTRRTSGSLNLTDGERDSYIN